LIGLFPDKFAHLLIALLEEQVMQKQKRENTDFQTADLKQSKKQKISQLMPTHISALTDLVKNIKAPVIGSNSFEEAQVCQGGIDTKEVDDKTLESKLVKGLYFCGEILDVDGICGGYNLQWAWSSGSIVGKEAAYAEN